MNKLKLLAKILLFFAILFYVYGFYLGILNQVPAPGDSFDYHIPISLSILDGSFLNLSYARLSQWYYPGSAEAINAILIAIHIPITVSNLIAAITLFFCLWKLALTFKLSYYYSLIFALTFSTLTVILRWLNAVSIDIWLAIFFVLTLILLERPQKKSNYYVKLGITLGMLIGTKFTSWYFLFILLIFYFKTFIEIFSIKKINIFLLRLILFIGPFSLLGIFWYFRNYILTGNPIYPIKILSLPGVTLFTDNVLNVSLKFPAMMINALYSEYHIWILAIPIAVWYVLRKRPKQDYIIRRIFLIGLSGVFIYLIFPTSTQPWIMVSSLRYSYIPFIFLILGVFMLAQHNKKQVEMSLLAIFFIFPTLSMIYYPKLLLIALPLFYLCSKLIENRSDST